MAASIRVTAVTHPGRVRNANEDCVGIRNWRSTGKPQLYRLPWTRLGRDPLLCVVADGLGGHAGGRIASRHAVHAIFAKRARLTGSIRIGRALAAVDKDIRRRMTAAPELSGMGTTIAGLVISPMRAIWFNIGDSRIYRVADAGPLDQISIDDRLPSDLAEAFGVGDGVLTSCLGGTPQPRPLARHVGSVALDDRARWLLCSDGLTDEIDDDTIRACLDQDDELAVRELLSVALWAGGTDNISAVLVSFDPDGHKRVGDHRASRYGG